MSSLTQTDASLARALGLEPASMSPRLIARAVQRRMRECGEAVPERYAQRALASPAESQALIEQLVVGETWFFREPKAFLSLRDCVSPPAPARLRLLSLGCSTGEEPYSMAMALTEAGLGPDRFLVDAVDVSRPAVEHGRRALYAARSLARVTPELRSRCFEETADGFRVALAVRERVRFEVGNAVDGSMPVPREPYQVVFCRHLLIYLHEAARAQLLATISRCLAAEGILVVGAAEVGSIPRSAFVQERRHGAFLFRPARAGAAAQMPAAGAAPARAKPWAPRRLEPASPRRAEGESVSRPPEREPERAVGSVPLDLEAVRQLADRGHLEEAERAGRGLLVNCRDSAAAHSLLGVILEARGRREEAAVLYRKAVYLDPQCEEALTHLALLARGQGRHAEAERLCARAARARQGERARRRDDSGVRGAEDPDSSERT